MAWTRGEAIATTVAEDPLAAAFARLAGGDPAALEVVWAECSRELYAVALWRTGSASDAEDVVQETLVRLARGAGRLGGVRQPRAWLLRIAHRAAIDLVRRRRPTETLDAAACELVAAADGATRAETAELEQALRALPAPQRTAIGLRYLLGLSLREIGRVTGVPTFTAASRCRLGLARLRLLFGESP